MESIIRQLANCVLAVTIVATLAGTSLAQSPPKSPPSGKGGTGQNQTYSGAGTSDNKEKKQDPSTLRKCKGPGDTGCSVE